MSTAASKLRLQPKRNRKRPSNSGSISIRTTTTLTTTYCQPIASTPGLGFDNTTTGVSRKTHTATSAGASNLRHHATPFPKPNTMNQKPDTREYSSDEPIQATTTAANKRLKIASGL